MLLSGPLRWCYLFSLPVSPWDPATAIPAVLDLVHLGKLVTHSSSMATLGAHKGDKVEWLQVNLEELLQMVWFHWYLWTPGTITFLTVQSFLWGDITERMKERVSEWMVTLEFTAGKVRKRRKSRIKTKKCRILALKALIKNTLVKESDESSK